MYTAVCACKCDLVTEKTCSIDCTNLPDALRIPLQKRLVLRLVHVDGPDAMPCGELSTDCRYQRDALQQDHWSGDVYVVSSDRCRSQCNAITA